MDGSDHWDSAMSDLADAPLKVLSEGGIVQCTKGRTIKEGKERSKRECAGVEEERTSLGRTPLSFHQTLDSPEQILRTKGNVNCHFFLDPPHRKKQMKEGLAIQTGRECFRDTRSENDDSDVVLLVHARKHLAELSPVGFRECVDGVSV